MEELTLESRNVERLRDEFYSLCKDYIERKKLINENNRVMREKLDKERDAKEDLRR